MKLKMLMFDLLWIHTDAMRDLLDRVKEHGVEQQI
jgi:hypothetical protein